MLSVIIISISTVFIIIFNMIRPICNMIIFIMIILDIIINFFYFL